MKIMQDYIVPVLRFSERGDRIYTEAIHGTAFFVNDQGTFVTAGHVIERCKAEVDQKGGQMGLVMRKPGDDRYRYLGKVLDVTHAERPYDVAVGVVAQLSKSCFVLGETTKVWLWDDVYTAGYPATATKMEMGAFRADIRGHKGHVLRKLLPGDFLMHQHPDVIEVSFAIPKGLSGAPLVVRVEANPDAAQPPPFVLLGVCVGNESAEILDHAVKEISEDGYKFEEKVKRVEEYGIVHDLRPLRDWKPACLGGLTLRDAINPNF